MGREFALSCHLQSDCKTVREWIMRPALFLHVAAPLVHFSATGANGFPDKWTEGEYRGSMKVFGVLPIGWQAIIIEFPKSDAGPLVLRDRGYGPMLRVWDHRIEAIPSDLGGTLYTDRLKLDAGLLTPIATFAVKQFFKHRQRRLRAADRTGFAQIPA